MTQASDVSRRSFLTTGAAGAGAVALAARDRGERARPISWDQTADVVIIGAGVAGLPAAITARDLGASVIVVEENYDIGGRGMLSGGRVQLGGGHALQQKFNIKDSADQVFPTGCATTTARAATATAIWCASSPTRTSRPTSSCSTTASSSSRSRSAAGRLDRAAHLRHQGMAHPGRGDRAASQPQRLGPGAPAGRKRAQEGRADPAQAQDDADRARASRRRQGARHRGEGRRQRPSTSAPARASSSPPAATPATSTSAACSIRG